MIVKYVDEETGEEIRYKGEDGKERVYGYEIEGKVGDLYKTEAKEIPYTELQKDKLPENAEGKLTENDETVIYYYKKMKFNLGVEKEIAEIKVNGEKQEISNKKLAKIEVPEKEIEGTEIEVKYKITVRNTKEIAGETVIEDRIPEGYSIVEGTSKEWKEENGIIRAKVALGVGESKELYVVLKWEQRGDNFGEKKNEVELTKVENPAGYEETTKEDNKDKASIIMAVKTGEDVVTRTIIIFIVGTMMMTGMTVMGVSKRS